MELITTQVDKNTYLRYVYLGARTNAQPHVMLSDVILRK